MFCTLFSRVRYSEMYTRDQGTLGFIWLGYNALVRVIEIPQDSAGHISLWLFDQHYVGLSSAARVCGRAFWFNAVRMENFQVFSKRKIGIDFILIKIGDHPNRKENRTIQA